VQRQERGHRREGSPDEDGPSVVAADADRREDDCGGGGGDRRQPHPSEVSHAGEVNLFGAENLGCGKRQDRKRAGEAEAGDESIAHESDIGSRREGLRLRKSP
jgi:hypothetical protein